MFGKLNDMLEKAKDSTQATQVFQQVNEKVGGHLDHLKNESHAGNLWFLAFDINILFFLPQLIPLFIILELAKEKLNDMGQAEMAKSVGHVHNIAKNSSGGKENTQ